MVLRQQMESTRDEKKTRLQRDSPKRPLVVIPYVQNVSDAVARITRKYDVGLYTGRCETVQNFKECVSTSERQTGQRRDNVCIKFLALTVTRLMWVKLEESLESGYKNTGQKLR